MQVYKIDSIGYDSNIYIIPGKLTTIIDTGTGLNLKETLYKIEKHIALDEIKQIVLTHEHFDHVGGAKKLKELTNGKIIAHENAISRLKSGKSMFATLLGAEMPKLDVDITLLDKDKLTIGDEKFEVIYTPGHSPGSICLYNDKNGILFSGDTVFAYGDFGRYDFPGGSLDLLVKSIEKLASLDVKDLYPGHGKHVLKDGKKHILMALQNIKTMG
jgi:glyoxylase-like metal-dependent hydrolase (beta-lactamase superfamily II)